MEALLTITLGRDDTQPTKIRWEALPPPSGQPERFLGGTKVGNGAWALAWVETTMELPPSGEEATKQKSMQMMVESAAL
jgi:chromatin structure-remodeling complex protein RSC7